MMLGTRTTKKVGRFLYNISPDGKTVAIAYRTLIGPFIGQKMVERQLRGILGDAFSEENVMYERFVYPGLVYNFGNISEKTLVNVLSYRFRR